MPNLCPLRRNTTTCSVKDYFFQETKYHNVLSLDISWDSVCKNLEHVLELGFPGHLENCRERRSRLALEEGSIEQLVEMDGNNLRVQFNQSPRIPQHRHHFSSRSPNGFSGVTPQNQ